MGFSGYIYSSQPRHQRNALQGFVHQEACPWEHLALQQLYFLSVSWEKNTVPRLTPWFLAQALQAPTKVLLLQNYWSGAALDLPHRLLHICSQGHRKPFAYYLVIQPLYANTEWYFLVTENYVVRKKSTSRCNVNMFLYLVDFPCFQIMTYRSHP
ncbi:hypothetical protein BD410DRAFT_133492 [Rickenella mellea]|uniref:Uncharacterized protein n=1 Tax=Rickenella mellea TaxID=50990 RepID=A0A4Y7Q8T7_9AGAM|nr:hypothetical protein BD410DRAFT_133492 [Rickenella mellea]